MKKLLIMILLFLSLLEAKEIRTLTLSTGFNQLEASLLHKILEEAFTQANLHLNFQILPNQRSLINANTGIVDGEAARIYKINTIYKNLLRVNVPIHTIDVVLISMKPLNVSKLKNLHIGVIRGGKLMERIAQQKSKYPIIKATSGKTLFYMLNRQRIDAIITNKIEAFIDIKSFSNATYYIYSKPLAAPKLYMYLHKKNKKFIRQIEKSLQKMQKEGKIITAHNRFNLYLQDNFLDNTHIIKYY